MSISYLPKLNPKVGKGLGGIPEKPAEGGGAASASIHNIINVHREILNITTSNQNILLPFTPSDIRNVGVVITHIDGGSSSGEMIFPQLSATGRMSPEVDQIILQVFAINLTTIRVNSITSNPGDCYIDVYEYDRVVKNSALLNGTSSIDTALPFSISDLSKAYVSTYLSTISKATVGKQILEIDPALSLCNINNNSDFFILDNDTYKTDGAAQGTWQFGIIEWE